MTQAAASVAAPLHTPADQVRVNRHHADWRGWKFMWPFALVFVFVFIIPIMYAIYISFFQKRMIGGTQFVGFANYIRLFHDQQFWTRGRQGRAVHRGPGADHAVPRRASGPGAGLR